MKKKHDGLVDLRLILPAAYWLDWASAEMFLDLIWASKHLVSKKYGPKNFGASIKMPNIDFHTETKISRDPYWGPKMSGAQMISGTISALAHEIQ